MAKALSIIKIYSANDFDEQQQEISHSVIHADTRRPTSKGEDGWMDRWMASRPRRERERKGYKYFHSITVNNACFTYIVSSIHAVR